MAVVRRPRGWERMRSRSGGRCVSEWMARRYIVLRGGVVRRRADSVLVAIGARAAGAT